MTSKEKLDKALGISNEKSMDDFLEDLDLKNKEHQIAISKIDTTIKKTIENIDLSLSELHNSNSLNNTEITDSIQKSLEDINELVNLSKQIIKHLYTDIVSSELVDAELISSTATFIQATHDNIKEYIELYRDRLKFFDTIKLEMIKHQNRKSEIELKHKLDMEKINIQNPVNAVPENMKKFSSEDVVNVLKSITI